LKGCKPRPLADRFWEKVLRGGPDECWSWIGTVRDDGYGAISIRHATAKLAHRVGWKIVNGPIPPKLLIIQDCDNRLCMNPSHWRMVTFGESVDRKVALGRSKSGPPRGEKHHSAKLKEVDVVHIRTVLTGVSRREIANAYNVSVRNVTAVLNRETWKTVG